MLYLFIISILVLCLLVALMFFILRKTVKTINNQTKLYFVDKVQEYDYLITQKEEQLEEIDKEIKEKESQKEEKELYGGTSNYEFDYNIIDLINKTKYQDKNIFTINKKIDEKFNLDYEAIIKKFLENTSGKEQYDFCNNLKKHYRTDKSVDRKMRANRSRWNYRVYLGKKDFILPVFVIQPTEKILNL